MITVVPLCSVAPTIAESASEVSVTAGQSAVLQCEVSGDPRPQVTWTKNGVRLSSESDPHYFIAESGNLEIFSAHPDDTATYSCTAINVAGVREKRVMLFVHGEDLGQRSLYITRGCVQLHVCVIHPSVDQCLVRTCNQWRFKDLESGAILGPRHINVGAKLVVCATLIRYDSIYKNLLRTQKRKGMPDDQKVASIYYIILFRE